MDKSERKANEALKDFIRYSSSPWRIVWVNFTAGIFRGLGAIIGASFVIALLLWLLNVFSIIPYVGKYANQVKSSVTEYIEQTNYNDEFDRLGNSLERIEKELAKPPTSDLSRKSNH